MSRFKDKFAIISGGASGMGAATAKRFAEEGGSVVTLDLNTLCYQYLQVSTKVEL